MSHPPRNGIRIPLPGEGEDAQGDGARCGDRGVEVFVRGDRAIRQRAEFLDDGHGECFVQLPLEGGKVGGLGDGERDLLSGHAALLVQAAPMSLHGAK